VGRLDGVADVFAISFRRFADDFTAWRIDAARVPLIRASLFAADEQLWRAIDCRRS